MMFKFFKPRYMLAAYLFLCFVFAVAAMNTTGTTSIALCILIFCFESVSYSRNKGSLHGTLTWHANRVCFSQCCFATIFTLALRGLGRHTKRGGSFLVSAISGGMVFPPMMGAVVVCNNNTYTLFLHIFILGGERVK
jgi:MFS transporter, FHS family, L-fucose permease